MHSSFAMQMKWGGTLPCQTVLEKMIAVVVTGVLRIFHIRILWTRLASGKLFFAEYKGDYSL